MTKEQELLDYLNVVTAEQSAAIPKTNQFTFISKITGLPQLWTLDERAEPKQFAEFEDRVMSAHHSPTGERTIVGMDADGNEKQQFFVVEKDGVEVRELVNEPEYFHHFGGWSKDGTKISFSTNRRHPGYFDIYVVDVASGETEKVFEYDGNCTPICWHPSGELLVINIRETNIDSAMYLLDIASGEKQRIGNEQISARYESIQIMADGSTGYVLTDAGEETLYIGKFSFDQPEVIEKLHHVAKWDMENFTCAPDDKKAVYTLNEGGISSLYVFDLATEKSEKIEGTPNGVIQSISWMGNEAFICTIKTPTMPGDCWKYSFSTNELERMTYVAKSEVEKNWQEPELFTFSSFDGLEVPYFYYGSTDPAGQNKPAVVYVHGGPESQTRADYNPVIQYLVHQGFTVVAPNVRGSRGYGRTYIQLDDARKRMDSVQDLVSLVDDLVVSRGVNKDKVGIIGRSYGGFMVLASLTHYPETWAAGVDIVGMSNLRTFLENTGAWRRRMREWEYGTLEHDTDFFEETAPLNHSHKIEAPLLIFHGRNDTRVPVSEAEQLYADMKKRGQDVEITIFDNEGHQTDKIENHITQNSEVVTFFKKHLLD